jgi:NhaP-type Na+/H+ or K+/H+ antiporter
MGPLSIGNVVSAALVLYRSHLKTYLRLALFAYLWLLVPIYGWAKHFAISGLIARLAFGELISKPENATTARSYTNSRLWSFFRVAFQVGLMLVGIYLGLFIPTYFIIVILGFGAIFISNSIFGSPVVGAVIAGIVAISGILAFLFGLVWFVSRWIVAEVPLAVEENINGAQSIERSWELTKNSVRRIQGIVVIAFLVSLPIVALTSYIPQIFLLRIEQGSTLYWTVYLISFITSSVGGIFILPFWQSIKAVVYYDLRSRREGLGLQIRDSMS